MAEAEAKTPLPPYVSFKAHDRFIDSLRDGHLPDQIDRGVLSSMSGSVQSAMLKSLEALGLITSAGKPTKRLKDLLSHARGSPEYKAQLRATLEATYPYLFGGEINLKTATTNQVQGVFRDHGVSGSTISKCIAFFLSAARDAGIEISKYVKTPPMADVGVKKRSPNSRSSAPAEASGDDFDSQTEIPMGPGIDLHPALMGVLATLPAPGQPITKREREVLMRAFEAVLSLAHPTSDEAE